MRLKVSDGASTRSSRSPRPGSSSSPSSTWRRGARAMRAVPGLTPDGAAGDEGGTVFDAGLKYLEAVNGNAARVSQVHHGSFHDFARHVLWRVAAHNRRRRCCCGRIRPGQSHTFASLSTDKKIY